MLLEFNFERSPESGKYYIYPIKWYSSYKYITSAMRSSGAAFDIKTKKYLINPQNLDDFKTELTDCGYDVNINIKDDIVLPSKEIKFFRKREKFDDNLLTHPHLIGKPPYEHYQAEDIEQAINQNRFLFNWGTGTGKSYALAYIIQRAENKGLANKYLILTTKIGCANLKSELLFFTKTLKPEEILVINSVQDLDDRAVFQPEYKIIILVYGALRFISDYYYSLEHGGRKGTGKTYRTNQLPLNTWFDGKPGFLFLDESHNLANVKSKQSKIVRMMCEECNIDYRYEFTGTFAHKFEHMYFQADILDKFITRYMDYQEWCGYYNNLGTRFSPYAINPVGWKQERLNELNTLLFKDYAVKRKSKDVLNIKDTIFVPPYQIEMSKAHREIYKEFVEEFFALLQQDSDSSFNQKVSLSAMVRANVMAFQACVDNPKAVLNNKRFDSLSASLKEKLQQFSLADDYNKLDYMNEILEERISFNDERGIIWYDHPATGDFLNEYIKYPHIYIHHGMSDMNEIVERDFKQNPECKLILASLRVMNTSITVTQAKFNIWMERTYSPVIYEQALGRIARYGQESLTRNYVILFKDSLDMLQNLVLEKGALILDKTLEKEFLSMADWGKLFNGKVKDLI